MSMGDVDVGLGRRRDGVTVGPGVGLRELPPWLSLEGVGANDGTAVGGEGSFLAAPNPAVLVELPPLKSTVNATTIPAIIARTPTSPKI